MPALDKRSSAYNKLQALRDRSSIFGSIRAFPKGVFFDGQEEEEEVYMVIRAHVATLIPEVIKAFLLFVLMVFISRALESLTVFDPELKSGLLAAINLIFGFFISASYLFYVFIKWFFNIAIITDSRLVDLDFPGLNSARWSSAVFSRIEDVTSTPAGFWSVLFDFGTVYVQTAAEQREFELVNIPRPREVHDLLLDLIENQ